MANLWILNQFKGIKPCISDVSSTTIHKCFKFHEILSIGYLVQTKLVDLKEFKGNNSLFCMAILTKSAYSV